MDDVKNPLRALVVDDEPGLAESLAMILRASGWHAKAAYSGEQAVQLCEQFEPHIVVADIVMGPMSGFDLAIHLAEHRPHCRIILMSGFSFHDPLVAKSVRHGFEFVPKPIDPVRFLVKINGPAPGQESPAEPIRETTPTDE